MENNLPFENNRGSGHEHIKDWGIDADPKNDPTYPMKKRTEEELKGYTWDRPSLQPVNIEVLHSIERPNLTAVFGTSVPPSGLSGAIRRFGFKYSENTFTHWLSLLFADRVNAVEGIIEDVKSGNIPNYFAEKGYKAQWKHNPKAVVTKVAIVAGVVAFVVWSVRNNKDDD
jgi:hypothetical protein